MPGRHRGCSHHPGLKAVEPLTWLQWGGGEAVSRKKKIGWYQQKLHMRKASMRRRARGLITQPGCELWFKVVKQTAVGSGWRERGVNGLSYRAFSPGGPVWQGVSPALCSAPPEPPLLHLDWGLGCGGGWAGSSGSKRPQLLDLVTLKAAT